MPKKSTRRSDEITCTSTRSVRYDLTRPENKTVSQLKDELDCKGIDYPRYARKSQLISLWKRSTNSQSPRLPNNPSLISSEDDDVNEAPRIRPETAEQDIRELRHEYQKATQSTTTTTTNACDSNNDGSLHTALLLSLTETVKSLADKVHAIQTPVPYGIGRPERRRYDEEYPKGQEFTLASAMSSMQSHSSSTLNVTTAGATAQNADYVLQQTQSPPFISGFQPPTSAPSSSQAYGFAADSLPFVETVSPAIHRQIIEGKDINLSVLLIPYYTGPMSNDEKIDTYYCSNRKPDPRLNKCLNISEFIQAFGTYKNIMCEAFPNRRHELDLYEREIVNMASRYPGAGFYDYHKQFSAKAASYLKNHNWKLDWSKRDSQLYSNIFTNYKSNCCQHCFSVSHLSDFCHRILQENKSAFCGPASNNYSNKRSG